MYIVTVIPIKKGIGKEYLTYFSAQDIPLGTIVTVPVRSKNIDAIVISIENAVSMKSDLKSRNYELKKITGVKGKSPFTKEFFIACERMKDYVVSSTGSVIEKMIPNVYLENIKDLKETDHILEVESRLENIKHEKLIFQALEKERLAFYRTLIREAFAKKQSVFICVPTRYDIEVWKDALVKGIEQYVYAFHGDINKKTLVKMYNDVISEPHPIIILGTGMFLSIPRADIKTIILEHESSDSYKQFGKPYLDIRSFVEVFSSITKTKLIFGDTLLRPDTLHRHDQGELGEIASPLFRLPHTERKFIVDMKEELDDKGVKKFTVISDRVKKMIGDAVLKKESVFLFSVRKGLAGVTVCHDCGHTLLCPECSTPVVLYGAKQRTSTKIEQNRIFMCNKCGHKETTEVSCKECGSWNLTALGIGTDRVYEEIVELFPKVNIIQIDKEATGSDKEARDAINSFYKNKGSILIGTELAFSYLNTKVDHSAIISLDGLLSIPSFNITQKILHIIEKLHYLTNSDFIIQTRNPDNKILEHVLSGNILPLYREDLKERERFGYPPFKRLIKITFSGTAIETNKARAFIDKILGEYDPQVFSAFIGKIRGQYITNTVIKIKPTEWQLPTSDKKSAKSTLAENLYMLPPSFSINVDPEDLL